MLFHETRLNRVDAKLGDGVEHGEDIFHRGFLKDEIMAQMSHVRDWGCRFVTFIPEVKVV